MNLYAVKFNSQNPKVEPGAPDKWPWLSQRIGPESVAGFEAAEWKIFTEEEFKAHIAEHQAAFDGWWKNRPQSKQLRLLVIDLLEQKFEHLHPSKIDFRRHLKPNVNLDKRVTMAKNGRPTVAEYSLDGQKICEIKFEFDVDAFGFMTRRRELLGYVNGLGEIEEHFCIYDQTFDPMNAYHARERVRERNEARGLIFDDIKSRLELFIAAYFLNTGFSYGDVLEMGGEFWEAYSAKISAWVNTGTPALKASITAETAFTFLDLTMPPEATGDAEPMTVRAFVLDRLTY